MLAVAGAQAVDRYALALRIPAPPLKRLATRRAEPTEVLFKCPLFETDAGARGARLRRALQPSLSVSKGPNCSWKLVTSSGVAARVRVR